MQRYVWHYLHNSSTGCTPIERVDTKQVRVVLPNVITGTEDQFVLAVNEQDQRTLVAFDGYLLAGSPKRKGACILQTPAGILRVPKGQFYAPEDDTLGVAPYVITTTREGRSIVLLEMYRHFLLLRVGTFVFAGYDATNLAPRYLIARIHKGGSRGEWVEWLVGG